MRRESVAGPNVQTIFERRKSICVFVERDIDLFSRYEIIHDAIQKFDALAK